MMMTLDRAKMPVATCLHFSLRYTRDAGSTPLGERGVYTALTLQPGAVSDLVVQAGAHRFSSASFEYSTKYNK